MSQFYTPSPMPATIPASHFTPIRTIAAVFAAILITGCSTPAQQLADAEIQVANAQEIKSNAGAPQGYLGGYSPNDPSRLSADTPYDPLNPELSETVALPFLSFLIIEPDPITKNAVPSDVEKLVKARKFEDAIELINAQLKKTPRNVQLRFVKARVQIEMRQFNQAKKTLIEITQQFPELPEPYNNLAAISANQGNWIEARDYLELALKLRPSYAIASANLGEIYIRLGAQAYENAAKYAQLNQGQYTRRSKALLDILKPPPNRQLNRISNPSVEATDANQPNTPPTNLPESRSK
ncbi:M48 family metallopeptidase [Polynucleobacter sp. MWH-Berg-3C6]|uniref:tetratricopeptide repeat protein n=1 Tax=Polynucleobacter sp. MWH-Berg-3C6 TaxID=1855882 RepID=UPI002102490D|nr:tetratricopeptide repeat protein [Polynucleobacter sp. MWH-Berg-3C6]MBU3550449.1 tetratricopeptide repeat protein [Polynucleobacter sp. MWH-Berg-3C6]